MLLLDLSDEIDTALSIQVVGTFVAYVSRVLSHPGTRNPRQLSLNHGILWGKFHNRKRLFITREGY
jgi:hypothetical protein